MDEDDMQREFDTLMCDLVRKGSAAERRAAIAEMDAFLARAAKLAPALRTRMDEQGRQMMRHAELEIEGDALMAEMEEALSADPDRLPAELMARFDAHSRAVMHNAGHDPDAPVPRLPGAAGEFFDAIEAGDLAAVRAAAARAEVNGRYGEFAQTPLYHAVAALDASCAVAELLLDLGADPREGMADGYTPLHGMAFSAFSEDQAAITALVRRMVAGGADPEALTDTHGWSPVALAIDEWNPKVLRALLQAGARIGETPGATLAAAFASPDLVAVLLDFGADPVAPDAEGLTALDRLGLAIARNDAHIEGILARGKTPDRFERAVGEGLRASLALMEARATRG